MKKVIIIIFASLFIYGCGSADVDSENSNNNSASAVVNNVNSSVQANKTAEIIAAKEKNPAAQNQISYNCDNNVAVDALYVNDFGKVALKISQNGQTKGELSLPREASASGVKFGNDKNVWWTKGKTAFFTEDGKTIFENCREKSAPKVTENQTDFNTQTDFVKNIDPETIRNYVGRTATQAGLKDNEKVDERMRKLMKNDFARMKKNWEVEEGIDYNENVAFLNGCKRSNCADDIYLVFYDVKKDNINVYHRTGGKIKTYFEKGKINLPPSFEAQIGLLKLN